MRKLSPRTHLRNLRRLLRIGDDLLKSRPSNFGFGDTDCGAYACLIGHYLRAHGPNEPYRDWCEIFGLRDDTAERLFGYGYHHGNPDADEPGEEAFAELERRLQIVRRAIKRKQSSAGETR